MPKKTIEEILEELKKQEFMDELSDKILEKITPYIDSKFEEQKKYIHTEIKKYTRKKITKKEKAGKLLLLVSGFASFKYCLDYTLGGMYSIFENFPKRPTEMYVSFLLGGIFGLWCYMSLHRSLTNHWL
ncbi:MAG: hypothetical protein PHW96_03155 [Candidatus Nanoarchaeia archaeon]|nr:hypothetical protein [Candidatus Omnitrophota bacterium]MDD5417860.1 hypothetical protein [Candidatus Nanoarchaeia archaeon]